MRLSVRPQERGQPSIYATQPELAFESIAACPACRTALSLDPPDRLTCSGCGRDYRREDGIWRFLLADQEARHQPFQDVYQRLRRGDGWERQDDSYYLNLPNVPDDDPHAAIWRLRRRTFGILMQHLAHRQPGWALDLGAGNCWLSRHLAQAGYSVLALDVNVESRDGLSGGSVYLERDTHSFLRGQAGMEHLPVHERCITLCIISAAFHYVNVTTTLKSVFDALSPGGQLVVMDSPVYRDKASGNQMMQEQLARFESQYGFGEVPVEGKGYLVFDEMVAALNHAGFSTTIRWPERPGTHTLRRLLRRMSRRREQARFPLFLGTKPQ